MDSKLNEELNKYYEAVFSSIICSDEEINRFAEDFPNDVEFFCEAKNVQNIETVLRHFGTPEEIAKSFID